MKVEDLWKAIGILAASGIKSVALLGGEPTLHSRFIDILNRLDSLKFTVNVGTCGICSSELVDRLCQANFTSNIKFGINTTRLFEYPPEIRGRVKTFMAKAKNLSGISYTVTSGDIEEYSPDPMLKRLELLERYPIKKHVTFQIAVPCYDNRQFISFNDYRKILRTIASWFELLSHNGATCNLDCHCIPKCAIPKETDFPIEIESKCTVFPVDIGPNLDAWPCFPYSRLRSNLNGFNNIKELAEHFQSEADRTPLLYEQQCDGCKEKVMKTCDCGCRGFQKLRETRKGSL